VSDVEVAWAAGFFDGEGCVGVNRVGGSLSLQMSVGQKNPNTLMTFQERIGGVGTVRDRQSTTGCYYWWLTNRPAGEVLTLLLPYLVEKRDQAVLAIEYAATISDKYKGPGMGMPSGVRARREEIRTELQRLKRVHGYFTKEVLEAAR
jgi:hypothetical protein